MASYEILTSQERLDELMSADATTRTILFKHSLTCPVSTAGFREFEKYVDGLGDDAGGIFALIQIQNQRPLSNRVAEVTGVKHESPQAVIMEAGKVLWHASHWDLTVKSIGTAFEA